MSFLYVLIGVILLPVVTCGDSDPKPVPTPHPIPVGLDIKKTECSLDNEDVLIHVFPAKTMIPVEQIVAKQNTTNCTVDFTDKKNYTYNITGCHKDSYIDVYFFENIHHITGGLHIKHFKIECKGLAKNGTKVRVSMKPEHVTDEATTKAPVTAKLEISMVVTLSNEVSPSSSPVSSFVIGQKYKLWIDGPENVFMYPESCTATPGGHGLDHYNLVKQNCAQDKTVLGDFYPANNFTHKGDLHAELYGFRFVSSAEVDLSCSIKVCPTLYCDNTEYLRVHYGSNSKCDELTTQQTTTMPTTMPTTELKTKEERKKRSILKKLSLKNGSRLRRDLEGGAYGNIEKKVMPTVHEVRMKLHVVDTPTEMSGARKFYDLHSMMLLCIAVLYTMTRRYF